VTSDIFPIFYSLRRTYTKNFIIFGSAQLFLHKIKHKSVLFLKEKRKKNRTAALAGPALGPQAGPRALRPSLSPQVADGGPHM